MEIFKNPSFDFLRIRNYSYIISAVVILIGIVSIAIHGGLRYNIDFTGGLSMEVAQQRSASGATLSVLQIREVLAQKGVQAEIQELPQTSSFLIKSKTSSANSDEIEKILQSEYPEHFAFEGFIRSKENVGPRAGADLRRKAVQSVLLSLLFLLIYIWIRFRFTWGFICAFGLLHDTLVALALLSLTGKEIGMTILAALLTIIGYSINNTIVIFDRIRENMKLHSKKDDYTNINKSINETLNRNVVLSFTTLLAIFVLLIFGGPVIHDFAFTLMVGIIAGTFSSIYIVTGLVFDTVKLLDKKSLMAKSSKAAPRVSKKK